jgi:hypothetical protein
MFDQEAVAAEGCLRLWQVGLDGVAGISVEQDCQREQIDC